MVSWIVKPIWKKSIIERNYLQKGDDRIMFETGWRWGEFRVYTEDENPPVLEPGVDILNCGYESEMIETEDGCWEEHDFDDCGELTQALIEEFLDDGNSWYDLMDNGWENVDSEMIIDCEMTIEREND